MNGPIIKSTLTFIEEFRESFSLKVEQTLEMELGISPKSIFLFLNFIVCNNQLKRQCVKFFTVLFIFYKDDVCQKNYWKTSAHTFTYHFICRQLQDLYLLESKVFFFKKNNGSENKFNDEFMKNKIMSSIGGCSSMTFNRKFLKY